MATPKIGTPFDVISHSQAKEGYDPYFHGPSTIVAANGDLLVATAQGRSHNIGVIAQARSKDKGRSWDFEGVVYDHAQREPGASCYNPAFALAPDGALILLVQTSRPDQLRQSGEAGGFAGYVYLTSSDHGKTYEYKGFVDPVKPRNVDAVTTNIVTRGNTVYFVSASYVSGCLLYTSEDNGHSWQQRSAVFRQNPINGTLWYPTMTFLPDGSLYVFALARMPDGEEKNYTRISSDDGRTWGRTKLAEGMSVRHPVLNWVGQTLIVHGRHSPTQDVIIHYSFDQGQTWSAREVVEDYDAHGGYSSSVHIGDRLFIAFSSDARRQNPSRTAPRVCSIRGVLVSP